MHLVSIWDEQLRAMTSAPEAVATSLDHDTRVRIERLIGMLDGAMEAEEDAASHPIVGNLRNWAPWSLNYVAMISSDVTTVLSCPGFSRVLRQLAQPGRYDSGLAEVEIAAELVKAGFKVEFIGERKRERTPDLSVSSESGRVNVEITRVGPAVQQEKAFQLVDRAFWQTPVLKGLAVRIEIRRFISRPHLAELKEMMLKLAEHVRQTGQPEHLLVEETIEAWIGPGVENATATSMSLGGPGLDVDEFGRLARVIEDKTSQLPEREPAILVVFDSEVVFAGSRTADYSPLVKALEEYVYDTPHLAAALVVVPYMDPTAGPVAKWDEQSAVWRSHRSGVLVEDRILVPNRFYKGSPVDQVLRALGCPSRGVSSDR